MKLIKDLTVNMISLVSKKNKPAVPTAETRFSIFKTIKDSVVFTDEQKERIEKLKQNLSPSDKQ